MQDSAEMEELKRKEDLKGRNPKESKQRLLGLINLEIRKLLETWRIKVILINLLIETRHTAKVFTIRHTM